VIGPCSLPDHRSAYPSIRNASTHTRRSYDLTILRSYDISFPIIRLRPRRRRTVGHSPHYDPFWFFHHILVFIRFSSISV
jgi:hypothetical protein